MSGRERVIGIKGEVSLSAFGISAFPSAREMAGPILLGSVSAFAFLTTARRADMK